MKKTLLLLTIVASTVTISFAQGGNGNSNNGNGNSWGNTSGGNGNGNGNGLGNGNGNANAYGLGGGSNGSGSGSSGSSGSSSSSSVSTGATQRANISLSNAIEITFTASGATVGNDVTLEFSTVNDYANGVETGAQELKVRSNKDFTVSIKSNSANFSYSGSTTPSPTMPVNGVLGVMVTANGTGGSIANPFSNSAYATITNSNQDIITSADRGGNQTFSVKYKATPGFAYPAGNYAVDVVYTATQD